MEKQGLEWLRGQILKQGGHVTADGIMKQFTSRVEGKPGGYESNDFEVGDQVHFKNPWFNEMNQPDDSGLQGSNLFWRGGQKPLIAASGGQFTVQEKQENIADWVRKKEQADKVKVDYYLRPHLPNFQPP